jgi:prepilin-type N-terminal cleavage/methylation domain-containing protein
MKKIIKKPSGFSLIELSATLLIIGILIVGITKGNRILENSRVANAISLTKNSPAVSTDGLLLWLDATDTNNFLTSEAVDGTNVTKWKDSNSQNTVKNNVSRTTSNNNITYSTSGINSLPALYYNGTNHSSSVLLGNVITDNQFTFFMVSKAEITSGRVFMFNGTPVSSGWGYTQFGTNHNFVIAAVSDNMGVAVTQNTEVSSGTYDGSNVLLFVNGVQAVSASNKIMNFPVGSLAIGNIPNGTSSWKGFIGEVIIFNRKLNTIERQAIEKYLGKKWGVKI